MDFGLIPHHVSSDCWFFGLLPRRISESKYRCRNGTMAIRALMWFDLHSVHKVLDVRHIGQCSMCRPPVAKCRMWTRLKANERIIWQWMAYFLMMMCNSSIPLKQGLKLSERMSHIIILELHYIDIEWYRCDDACIWTLLYYNCCIQVLCI